MFLQTGKQIGLRHWHEDANEQLSSIMAFINVANSNVLNENSLKICNLKFEI